MMSASELTLKASSLLAGRKLEAFLKDIVKILHQIQVKIGQHLIEDVDLALYPVHIVEEKDIRVEEVGEIETMAVDIEIDEGGTELNLAQSYTAYKLASMIFTKALS